MLLACLLLQWILPEDIAYVPWYSFECILRMVLAHLLCLLYLSIGLRSQSEMIANKDTVHIPTVSGGTTTEEQKELNSWNWMKNMKSCRPESILRHFQFLPFPALCVSVSASAVVPCRNGWRSCCLPTFTRVLHKKAPTFAYPILVLVIPEGKQEEKEAWGAGNLDLFVCYLWI